MTIYWLIPEACCAISTCGLIRAMSQSTSPDRSSPLMMPPSGHSTATSGRNVERALVHVDDVRRNCDAWCRTTTRSDLTRDRQLGQGQTARFSKVFCGTSHHSRRSCLQGRRISGTRRCCVSDSRDGCRAVMHEVPPDDVNLIALTMLIGMAVALIGLIWLAGHFLF